MVLHEGRLILDPDVFAGLAKEKLQELETMGARAALPVLTKHMVKVLKERRAKERGKGRKRGIGKKAEGPGIPFTTALLEPRKTVISAVDPSTNITSSVCVDVEADEVQTKPPLTVAVPVPDPVPMDLAGSAQSDIGTPIVIVDDDEGPAAKRRRVSNDVLG